MSNLVSRIHYIREKKKKKKSELNHTQTDTYKKNTIVVCCKTD
jgi:hypothetical protein